MAAGWFTAATAGSAAGGLMRQTAWERTDLGDPERWPPTLVNAVVFALATPKPVLIAWGPQLTTIFNDACRDIFRAGAPDLMGKPARVAFADLWGHIGGPLERVMADGASIRDFNARLVLTRSGVPEEVFFSSFFGPLQDDVGPVRGVVASIQETTAANVDTRRLQTLSELAAALRTLTSPPTSVGAAAIAALRARADIAWAQLWLVGADGVPRPVATTDPAVVPPLDVLVKEVLLEQQRSRRGRVVLAPLLGRVCAGPHGVFAVEGTALRPFDADHGAFLDLVAETVAVAVVDAREHSRRLNRYQRISRALQRAVEPDEPTVPGWHARYRPADGSLIIGGDWHDVVDLGDDRTGVVVGDCVGHGLAAAGLMGQLQAAARALLLTEDGPAATLTGLDHYAQGLPGAPLTTIFCAIKDERRGTFTYASAGHLPALRIGPSAADWLADAVGLPLGLVRGQWREVTIELEPQDVVILYTDGLVERRGEPLRTGLNRLLETARELVGERPAAHLPDALIARLVRGFRDDVAVVVHDAGAGRRAAR